MKRLYFLLLLAVLMLSTSAQPLQPSDSILVTRMLAEAPADASPLHFARLLKGRPYVSHTLEVNDEEQLVVNLRQLDCTTLVESAATMALCVGSGQRTYGDYCRFLTQLRYRQGRIDGYPSRLHYFTDWINDNVALGLVRDLATVKAPFTAVQTVSVDYMSRHPQSYKALTNHPEFVSVIAAQERHATGQKHRYIPKAQIRNTTLLCQVIHDGDILAITCTRQGLDIAHVGIAVWHADGLHMLHASSLKKKVIEDPLTLSAYLKGHPSFTGIRVIRVQSSTARASW
ncbi:MAG: DUF1460 domain-containing protein [Prevotella sp.]|nr:DUF1460 domain-containing protein [Prevotella sp.]